MLKTKINTHSVILSVCTYFNRILCFNLGYKMNEDDLLKTLLTPLIDFAHSPPPPTEEQTKEKKETKQPEKNTTKSEKATTKKRKPPPDIEEKPKKKVKKVKKKESVSFDTFL